MLAHEFPLEPHTDSFNGIRHTGLFPNPTPLLTPTGSGTPTAGTSGAKRATRRNGSIDL